MSTVLLHWYRFPHAQRTPFDHILVRLTLSISITLITANMARFAKLARRSVVRAGVATWQTVSVGSLWNCTKFSSTRGAQKRNHSQDTWQACTTRSIIQPLVTWHALGFWLQPSCKRFYSAPCNYKVSQHTYRLHQDLAFFSVADSITRVAHSNPRLLVACLVLRGIFAEGIVRPSVNCQRVKPFCSLKRCNLLHRYPPAT